MNNTLKTRSVGPLDSNKLKTIKPELPEKTLLERLKMQSRKEVDYLILEDESNPVAFVLLKWIGKPTHPEYPDIEDLYTKADSRGKGYASFLIYECEKLARDKGFRKIGLAVNPENEKAINLYLKLGFIETGEGKYLDGIYDGVEDWVMDLEKEIY